MPLDHAAKVIDALKRGAVPAPSRKEIQRVYEQIYKKVGEHSEPLRSQIYGNNALAAGPILAAKLSAYLLQAVAAPAAAIAPSKPRPLKL